MLRLRRGYLCTKREFNLFWDCSDVVRPPAASCGVSWLIFEPEVSKIAYESTLESEYFHLHNGAQSHVFRS